MSESDEIRMMMPTTETQEQQRSEQQEEYSELHQEIQEHEQEADEEEEEEFSFVCLDPDTSSSPISADDLFYEGQIKPLYPLFNQALIFSEEDDDDHHQSTSPRPQLRKIFIEHHPPAPSSCSSKDKTEEHTPTEITFCEWSGKPTSSPIASPDRCKKSNSTGFSKLWRFRDLLHRSSSDGKDTFIFLHHPPPSTVDETSSSEVGKHSHDEVSSVVKCKAKVLKGTKTEKHVSAHERHYMRNRVLKEEEKRRSYLPYKVGFFTSASGLSRNVHPF